MNRSHERQEGAEILERKVLHVLFQTQLTDVRVGPENTTNDRPNGLTFDIISNPLRKPLRLVNAFENNSSKLEQNVTFIYKLIRKWSRNYSR